MIIERKLKPESTRLLLMLYQVYGDEFIKAIADIISVNGTGDCYECLCGYSKECSKSCEHAIQETVYKLILGKDIKG